MPRDKFHLRTPERNVATYTFNKHVIAAVNARCLEGVDLGKLAVQHFDGRSL